LRKDGFTVDQDYSGGSMKSQMRKANKSAAQFTLIVGENEIKSGKYLLKDMETGSQSEISAKDLTNAIREQMENPSSPAKA
jgi:histidyl-tRNA synthetase